MRLLNVAVKWINPSGSTSVATPHSRCCWGAEPRLLAVLLRPLSSPCATARSRPRWPLVVRDVVGDHFTLGAPRHVELTSFDVVLLRQDPPFDLAYVSTTRMLERVQPKTLVVNDSSCAQRAGENFRHRISRPDAADADYARPGSHQGLPRRATISSWKPPHGKAARAVTCWRRKMLNFGSLYGCSPACSASNGSCKSSCPP